LTEIINQDHENKKYLPGVQLPENVVAVPDIGQAVEGATAIVFVMPHQCKSTSSPVKLIKTRSDGSPEQSPLDDGGQTPQRCLC
jgi:glycerol-3-phosphate dehydrogenase